MKFSLNRRSFLKLLGLGSASAALSSCSSEPVDKIIPYLIPPEESVPGLADWYATVCRECPAGCGMIVKLREGRPVKVEGNRLHPINRGGLCMRGQASLQGLYNPDRIREPMLRQENGTFKPVSWEEAEKILADLMTDEAAFITPLMTGSLESLLQGCMDAYQVKNRLVFEPVSYENIREACKIVFSQDEIPLYSLDKAEMILSFGADFLETWISPVEYAKGFAAMKVPEKNGRFVFVGPRMSLTSASADAWIKIKPGTEKTLVLGLIHFIIKEGLNSPVSAETLQGIEKLASVFSLERAASETGVSQEMLSRLAVAFAQAKPGLALGGGVSVQGPEATETMAAINILNAVTGNIGKTVHFGHETSLSRVHPFKDMLGLIESVNQEKTKTLFLYDVDPLYSLPGSSGFKEALDKASRVVSFSSFMNDTAKKAHLIIPVTTPLEEWGDFVPRKGIYGLQQPVMRPLYQARPFGDILLTLKNKKGEKQFSSFHDSLKDSWKDVHGEIASQKDFELFWQKSLRQGGAWTSAREKKVRISPKLFGMTFSNSQKKREGSYSLILSPSVKYYNGKGANRPVLQEIPDPVSQIAWDSWVEINPETASALRVKEGDFVAVTTPNGRIEAPVHLYEGIGKDVLAVPLGLGHEEYGRYAEKRGVNPVHLFSGEPEPFSGGLIRSPLNVTVEKLSRKKRMAMTQGGRRQFGRRIARALFLGIGRSILHLKSDKEVREEKRYDIYEQRVFREHHWAMVIDLNLCTGCNACVASCYMENNIAVVGEEEVRRGREMAWLRVEKYIESRGEKLETRFIPMLCQHCDNAPCEPVCPVYATYHNPEGLNAMIYNRCVGTRYCSNNCPYKARRFNWFLHSWPEPLNWQLNPDVTVREVGVMEKCTFCVQRIREKKEQAKHEGRKLLDGEVVPACAESCPTGAIVFGDLKDPESRVSRLAKDKRSYTVLENLNTKPSVIYLKKIIREI